MNQIRFGIIGIGNIGSFHTDYLMKKSVPEAVLTAVCDIKPDRLEWVRNTHGEGIALFDDAEAMMASGLIDAVIIGVPHYDHPTLALKALSKGLHVLIEKPAGVYTQQVREMNEAAAKSGKVFGIMYNQRTNPIFQKMRRLVQDGELGEIRRTNWIITTWYRSQAYYDSGTWRATWAGEGGGVLINQCPHNLDIWQWICGVPKRVRAFCGFGKYRNIEVEDAVTAYVEYENGATGVFITTTAEAPGTDRFEIVGTRGKIVLEGGKLTFWRLEQSEPDFNSTNKIPFATPETWVCDIPVNGKEAGHPGITQNFAQAVLNGTPLLAPGIEGIRGLQISNAIHLSTWTDDWVDIPVDENLYYEQLKNRIDQSNFNKAPATGTTASLEGTF